MDKSNAVTLQIRKLRKKLRQIENLEGIDRDLTDEELSKCIKKDAIRETLLDLLANHNENNSSSRLEVSLDSVSSWNTDLSNTSQTVSETDVNLHFNQATESVTESARDVVEDELQEQYNNDYEQENEAGDGVGETNVTSLETEKESEFQTVGSKKKTGSKQLHEQKDTTAAASGSGSNKSNKRNPSPERKQEPFKQPLNVTHSPVKKSKKAVKEPSARDLVEERWRTSGFHVTCLESHNDLVTAVDTAGSIFVSASRDTTVKVWDVKTLRELRSLGSHTGSVTSVVVLQASKLGPLGVKLGIKEDDYLVLSGSMDCSLKVWSANTGELLKSIYTFNPVTKIAFYSELSLVLTASDGGKLELWDIDTQTNVYGTIAHSDTVTGLCVRDNKIYTSCGVEGAVAVYEVRDRALHCMYVSEDVRCTAGHTVNMRHIRTLDVKGDNLYYGDDGVNVKILSWKKSLVKRLANHAEEFGITDGIRIHGNLMIASAYDLDKGQGYFNVFDMSLEPTYIASVNDEDTGRILDICCCHSNSDYITMVTAGVDLQVWRQVPLTRENQSSEGMVCTRFVPRLSRPAEDSDMESDVEFTDSEDEAGGRRRGSRRGSTLSQKAGWGSWCNIV